MILFAAVVGCVWRRRSRRRRTGWPRRPRGGASPAAFAAVRRTLRAGREARTKPVIASRRLWTPAKQSRACSWC